MFNKNGETAKYNLKFGINNPRPSDEEMQEFLDEMRRRAKDKGIIISKEGEEREEQRENSSQMRLFD